jgi:maleate isomerase
MPKTASLIISEENPTLPRDVNYLYPGRFNIFIMKFYPGHGIRKDEMGRMYKELSQIKHEVEKSDVIVYARSYGVFFKNQWERMRKFFSKPTIIATEAIITRLRELEAKKKSTWSPLITRGGMTTK